MRACRQYPHRRPVKRPHPIRIAPTLPALGCGFLNFGLFLSGLGILDAATSPVASKSETAEVRVRIVDADTRQPLASTVRLVDALGRVATNDAGFNGGFRTFGSFVRSLIPGAFTLRVTRGPEYLAAETNAIAISGEARDLEIALVRQVDLGNRGWYAHDHHVHMLHGERTVPVDFEQMALAARAEGLRAISIAQAWSLENPTPERLEEALARRSGADLALAWNLEAPKNYFRGDAGRCLGHCWNLAMRGRTPDGQDVIATLLEASAWDYESDKPSYANFESHALIHAQGGFVFYTHPARWWTGAWGGAGGYPKRAAMRVSNMAVELPLDTLAGPTFDGMDVITGAGEAAADENAFRLWCLLLEHGYRVAATASSDACFDRPGGATPGAARLYTFLDEPFSFPAMARATARGHTVATTGPLLLASVDGRPPGTAFAADGRSRTLRIEAWPSGAVTGRLDRVEVYRDGREFRRFEVRSDERPWVKEISLSSTNSTSVCVRAFGTDARRQRAVSGAFYFDAAPWRTPDPVPAQIHVQVLDEVTGQTLDATLTEVAYLGTRPVYGRTHRVTAGVVPTVVSVPATVRVRVDVEGYQPETASPFFDHPELVSLLTTLDDQGLTDWSTFERVRKLLNRVPLTFRMKRRLARP